MPRSKVCRRIGPAALSLRQRRNIKEHFRAAWIRAGSQRKAAAEFEIGASCFYDIMSDRGAPSLAVALRVAKRLGISVEQLVNGPPAREAQAA